MRFHPPLLPQLPDWRSKPIAELSRAEKVMAFIERYIRIPEGEKVGQKLVLTDFQQQFIYAVYDNPKGTRLAILSMARKNAKTATIAALLIAHLCGPEAVQNSSIISGAMSRDQASLVFKLAVKMISLNDTLQRMTIFRESAKRITGIARNVDYHAIAAESSRAHGLSPIFIILDEIGQIRGPSSPFIDALTTSQGAYKDPLLIAISTQAANDADMLSIWIDDAFRNESERTVCHLYEADRHCELMDEAQWARSNPGLDSIRSRDDLREQMLKAKRMPSNEAAARNLLLNCRIALEQLWIPPTPWKRCSSEPDLELYEQSPEVAIGIDLSDRADLTAAVLAVKDNDGYVSLLPFVYTPSDSIDARGVRDRAPYRQWVDEGHLIACPGSIIDYDYVAEHLAIKLDELNIHVGIVAFDRWRIDSFKKSANTVGIFTDAVWVPVGQGYRDISPRIDAFEKLLLNHKIKHGAHPLLSMAASNAILVRDAAGNKKIDKSKSTLKIDPLIAAIMAAFEVTETSVSTTHFDVQAIIG